LIDGQFLELVGGAIEPTDDVLIEGHLRN
jgi:hypothetical protein